jgi:profilin
MNQLQNLLHDALTLTNHVAKCALIDYQNAKLTSSSIGYHPDQNTINTLANAFENIDKIRMNGLDFEGTNYKCIRGDDEAIYTKEVSVPCFSTP